MRKQKNRKKIKVPKLLLINSKYFKRTRDEVVYTTYRQCGKTTLVREIQISLFKTLSLVKKNPKLKKFLPQTTFCFKIKDVESEEEYERDYFNRWTAGAELSGGFKRGEMILFGGKTGLNEGEERVLVVDNKVMVPVETKDSNDGKD